LPENLKSYPKPVHIIAFGEFDNLGVGYLCAVLKKAGYRTLGIDITRSKEAILETVREENPFIIGFSVIFPYHIYRFRDLVRYLRCEGITCHFTAGGSYPSLRPEDLFKTIPGIDSIVRFEGEHTFLDLVKSISKGSDNWKNLKSIAYRENGKVIANPLRPFESDLDKFPFPLRSSSGEYAFGKKYATIISGRGCIYNCSYCNNSKFYGAPPGPVKRLRRPEKVVEEMKYLYKINDCQVFLFQDDDFPVKTRNGSEWVSRFCDELIRNKLHKKVLWKINCRPDEVDEDTFETMKHCGLFMVFVGLEDGSDEGLKSLNRTMTIARSVKGIRILKKLEIGFDYGFMLFQPSSTYKSVNLNLNFLRKLFGDGYTPVTFLKLMPFFETAIEEKLRREGRLKGRPGFHDYDFIEDSMNHYYRFVTKCFLKWQRDPEGLSNIAKWARNFLIVYDRFYGMNQKARSLKKEIRKTIKECNLFFIDTLMELAVFFESGQFYADDHGILKKYAKSIKSSHSFYLKRIKDYLQELSDLVSDNSSVWLF
jgi:anaerobic magnesium-protoporphyrin IX monomethyl ester cyclase